MFRCKTGYRAKVCYLVEINFMFQLPLYGGLVAHEMNLLMSRALLASRRLGTPSVRHVGSLGPLAAAFNSKQSVQFKFNWLQSRSQTGLFGIPELKDSHGWAVLQERCFRNCESLVEEVTSDGR